MKKEEKISKSNNLNKAKRETTIVLILTIISIVIFGTVCIGSAYALIAARIVGNETNGDITVKTPQVYAIYEATGFNVTDVLPGFSKSYDFYITNTSTTENTYGNYSIVWNIDNNELNSNDFVYTLVGETYKDGVLVTEELSNNTLVGIRETRVPEMSTILGTGTINTGVTHKYKLTITFKETGTSQNELQNKSFTSQIVVKGEAQID